MTMEERLVDVLEAQDLAAEIALHSLAETPDDEDEDGEVEVLPAAVMSAEDLAKALAKAKAQRLKKAAVDIRKARSVITQKMLHIADLLESAKGDLRRDIGGQAGPAVSPAKLRAYAHVEAGIPRDEISTYQTLSTFTPSQRQVLQDQGAGFAVLKAITGNTSLRQDVINRMNAGIVMDLAAVRSVRRMRKLEAETQLRRLLRLQPQLSRISDPKEMRSALKELEAEASVFARELVDLYQAVELPDEAYQQRGTVLIDKAKALLRNLERIVDTEEMPFSWREFWVGGYDLHGFEEALLALRSIADGHLFVPDEDFEEGYLETDDANADHRLVRAVARLADARTINLGEPARRPNRGAKRGARQQDRLFASPEVPKLVEVPKPLRSIEICAGAGGQALGLHAAGFHSRATFEFMEDAAQTLRANFGTAVPRIFTEDIAEVDFTLYKDGIDLVAGGVPCQPFSTAGERQGEDDERDLFRRAVEIVDEVRPRAFFFENVKGFGHAPHMAYRAELHAAFAAIGYESRIFVMMGSDYGLAQDRPRIAFIGFRDPDAMNRFRMPPIFPQWQMSLAEAIGDLVSANGWKGFEAWKAIANGKAPTIVGGSRKNDAFSFSTNLRHPNWKLLGVDSKNLIDEAPGPDHKGLIRLTLAMGARLQGFPDDWRFMGRKRQIKSQIGNALPPVMARAVGLAIYAALEGVEFDYVQTLKLPMTLPKLDQEQKRVRETRLRPASLHERHRHGEQIRQEHAFFGELSEELDSEGRAVETVVDPGSYRLRDGTIRNSDVGGWARQPADQWRPIRLKPATPG
jgi:DNA (cytosine-5)-methyltransferase 1